MSNDAMQLFEDQPIRSAWDAEREEWYFSVVDVVGALTDQKDKRGASNYWAKLKQRLKDEGADELLTNCQQLKLKSKDGKRRLTDVADTEQLLAIRIRNELTDEWSKRGVQKVREYAILTDEINKAWSGMTTRQYKDLKGAQKGEPARQHERP